MTTLQSTDPGMAVLRAFAAIQARGEVATVQAAANESRITFMLTYDLLNELFIAGYLKPDLTLTEAGTKVLAE